MTSPWYIGVDIGGTKIGVSRFDVATASVVEVERFPTGIQCEPVVAIDRVVDIARVWIEQAGSSPEAVGVSVGGMYDVHSGCMRHAPHLPLWDGFPIISSLKEAFGAPVFGENDANACALAEWRFGAGRGCNDLIFLTFGTGLGAGLILDGKLPVERPDLPVKSEPFVFQKRDHRYGESRVVLKDSPRARASLCWQRTGKEQIRALFCRKNPAQKT